MPNQLPEESALFCLSLPLPRGWETRQLAAAVAAAAKSGGRGNELDVG